MPSSVGHILAGLAISRLTGRSLQRDWPIVAVAAAPDLDVVVDALRDRPTDYRNRPSHTAGAALFAAASIGTISKLSGGPFFSTAARAGASYASHLVLDYFGKESQDGLPLLRPFSTRRFAARRPVFRTIYSRHGRFFTGLLTRRNLRKIARETAILAPYVVAADVIGRLRR